MLGRLWALPLDPALDRAFAFSRVRGWGSCYEHFKSSLSSAILEDSSLSLPHTPSHVSGSGWDNESMSPCVLCEARRAAWPTRVFLIRFPREVSGQGGAKWVGYVPFPIGQWAGLLQPQRPPCTLWGTTVQSVGCSRHPTQHAGWPGLLAALLTAEVKGFKSACCWPTKALSCRLAGPHCHREATLGCLDVRCLGRITPHTG